MRKARAQFMQEWHLYLHGLTELLAKQVEKKNQTMAAYAESEEKWEAQLLSSTKAIQQASGGAIEVNSGDESQMEVQEAEVSLAAATDVARQTALEAAATQEKDLMAALASTAAAAQVQADEYRERTPRRRQGASSATLQGALPQPAAPTPPSMEKPATKQEPAPPGKAQ